ncbi:cytochrome P450 [Frankia gtarii]|uniref:cytochrome P450 n=1 Tax=Frankia gtarii TaxID=2950102 RepID=UPI0021C1F202|nr:cytochrome P450 [Frankia gtarii]
MAPRPAAVVPGPAGNAVAALRRLRADPLTRFLDLRREYGPVVHLATWPVSAYLVSDPEAIADALVGGHHSYGKGAARRGRDGRMKVVQPLSLLLGRGLLTSSGPAHRTNRRLMQPLFHRQRIAGYGAAFSAIADSTARSWHDGQHLDIHAEMTEMTLEIVARTLFDVALDDALIEVVRTALNENMPVAGRLALPGFGAAERLPLPAARRRRASRDALDRTVYGLIARRRAAGATGDDLLCLLLSTQDAETGVRMDDTQVRDEALTLLLAGHETTANALSWTFHLLGANPQAERELHAELDTVLGERPPTIDDLPRLTYTQAVLNESMRLYPPVWAMGRHLVEDRKVGGHLLPAGSTLLFSQWVVHRDERWWPDPDRFDPTRWLRSGTDAAGSSSGTGTGTGSGTSAGAGAAPDRPRFAYFPFGGGPRQCIGNTFALAEGALALAAIARRWSLHPVPGIDVVPQPLVTLRPRDGLPMTAHIRRPS